MSHAAAQLTASLQTPPGKGGIAVISLAGSGVESVLCELFRMRGSQPFPQANSDMLHLGTLVDGEEILDEAVLAFTPRGAEINIHGSPLTARRILRRLAKLGVTITAQPDVPFAPAHPQWNNPAIGHELQTLLPDAPSLLAASLLTNQWANGLSKLARELLDATTSSTKPADALARLQAAADAFTTVQRLLQPAEVVLAGPPNAGKSTLANALIGRPVSIVHELAGTTRDWIRERAILKGCCVHLTDTAGLWDTDHPVDAESVRRAWERISRADLVLLLSAGEPIELPPHVHVRSLLHVQTKCDDPSLNSPQQQLMISAHTGQGIAELIDAILRALHLTSIDPSEPMAFTLRQKTLLLETIDAMRRNDNSWRTPMIDLLEGNV